MANFRTSTKYAQTELIFKTHHHNANFKSSTKYTKLAEFNIENTLTWLDLLQDQRLDSFAITQQKYQILANPYNRVRTPIRYIAITIDGICRRSASSGKTVSTFSQH